MRRWILGGLVLGYATLAAGSSALQARQDNTPGMPTIARVFILNRGGSEAVPVILQAGPDVQPVQIAGTATVRIASEVTTERARQQWEYRQLAVSADEELDELLDELNEAGDDGWEVVGPAPTGGDRAALILKRPR